MLKRVFAAVFLSITILQATIPTQENVAKLYVATFNRAPDAAGLNFWIFDSGFSLEDIARSFFDQPETKMLYPDSTSNREFIRSTYANLFNRQPAADGEAYWLDALESGKVSKSVFILAVVNGALGSDAEILNNKTLVGITFALMDVDSIELAKSVMSDVDSSAESVNSAIDKINNYIADGKTSYDSYTYDNDNIDINIYNGSTENENADDKTPYDSYTHDNESSADSQSSDTNQNKSYEDTLNLSYDYLSFWREIVADLKSGNYYNSSSYLYASMPNVNSCDMGQLSEGAKSRALQITNYSRELHGLSPLSYNYDYDNEVQAASLIMKANTTMSHTPSSSSQCYSDEGYNGSSSSDLYAGYRNNDPAKEVVEWIDDSSNASTVSAVGHRRWLLNPFGLYMSYGQIEGWSALKVFNFGDSASGTANVDFIAFPYKRYPYIFVNNKTPWSFTVIEDHNSNYGNAHEYFNNATISIIEKSSGKALNVSKKYSDAIAYGVPNILSWQVSNWKQDTLYEVTISNVNMQSGLNKSFTYDIYIDYQSLQ